MAISPRGGRKSVQNLPTRDDGTRVSEKEGTVETAGGQKKRGPEPSELSKKCESAVLLLLLRKIVYRLIGARASVPLLCHRVETQGGKGLPCVPRNREDSGTNSELGRSSEVIRIPELLRGRRPSAAGHGLLISTELVPLGYQRGRRDSQLRKIQRI